jgi:hypothetical protein
MRVEIKRITEGSEQTEGVLTVYQDCEGCEGEEAVFRCYTLELPWKDNKKRISCIPKNEYNVEKRYSTKYKNHFHILDVPNRSYILVHSGNYNRHTLGCVLVGKTLTDINGDGLRDTTHSKSTMKKLNDILPPYFKITIL